MTSTSSSCIAVIDHGFANIGSITNVLKFLGFSYVVIDDGSQIMPQIDGFILPGVGAFGAAMQSLRDRGLDQFVCTCVSNNIKGLGICLGMQMLASFSEEDDFSIPGLGLFPGVVKKLNSANEVVPHMGWSLTSPRKNAPIHLSHFLDGIFYYVHSYAYDISDSDSVLATTFHGSDEIVSSIYMPNLLGLQFHPEKSQHYGLSLLKNYFLINDL